MNIDEPDEEHITDEDFHEKFSGNVFHDLVADDILDHNINQNNADMEGGRQDAGKQGLQRMGVVDLLRNLPKFSADETELADNHLGSIWWLPRNATN